MGREKKYSTVEERKIAQQAQIKARREKYKIRKQNFDSEISGTQKELIKLIKTVIFVDEIELKTILEKMQKMDCTFPEETVSGE